MSSRLVCAIIVVAEHEGGTGRAVGILGRKSINRVRCMNLRMLSRLVNARLQLVVTIISEALLETAKSQKKNVS